jgi:hypothetical protein
MSYVPNNVSVYTAAFTGCVGGITSHRRLFSTSVMSYNDMMRVAGAWAAAIDTLWVGTPTELDIENIGSMSIGAFADRFPNPKTEPKSVLQATYASQALALVAALTSGQNYYAGQSIIPPPLPGGGVTSVSGDAPIISSGGTAPHIGLSPISDANVAAGAAIAQSKIAVPATVTIGEFNDIDWTAGNFFKKTLPGGANAMTFSDEVDGKAIVVKLTGGGLGSTVSWPAEVEWAGGTAPIQTPTGTDTYTFANFDGVIEGSVLQAMASPP